MARAESVAASATLRSLSASSLTSLGSIGIEKASNFSRREMHSAPTASVAASRACAALFDFEAIASSSLPTTPSVRRAPTPSAPTAQPTPQAAARLSAGALADTTPSSDFERSSFGSASAATEPLEMATRRAAAAASAAAAPTALDSPAKRVCVRSRKRSMAPFPRWPTSSPAACSTRMHTRSATSALAGTMSRMASSLEKTGSALSDVREAATAALAAVMARSATHTLVCEMAL
mmetsp:Transcript_40470/g.94471  ORF Transcript_40470/g.94471 Transcript_40470/m.94471 type:complete len:235 (+) Transcript_40470:908-1612(+)